MFNPIISLTAIAFKLFARKNPLYKPFCITNPEVILNIVFTLLPFVIYFSFLKERKEHTFFTQYHFPMFSSLDVRLLWHIVIPRDEFNLLNLFMSLKIRLCRNSCFHQVNCILVTFLKWFCYVRHGEKIVYLL